jgi:hypothetical protein
LLNPFLAKSKYLANCLDEKALKPKIPEKTTNNDAETSTS